MIKRFFFPLITICTCSTDLFLFFISGHEPSSPPRPSHGPTIMGSDGHPPPHPENVHHHHHHQEEPPPPPPPPVPAEEPPVITIEEHLPPPEHVHHHQPPPQEETGCSAFLRGWFVLSLFLSQISYSCLIKLLK